MNIHIAISNSFGFSIIRSYLGRFASPVAVVQVQHARCRPFGDAARATPFRQNNTCTPDWRPTRPPCFVSATKTEFECPPPRTPVRGDSLSKVIGFRPILVPMGQRTPSSMIASGSTVPCSVFFIGIRKQIAMSIKLESTKWKGFCGLIHVLHIVYNVIYKVTKGFKFTKGCILLPNKNIKINSSCVNTLVELCNSQSKELSKKLHTTRCTVKFLK